MPIVSMYKCHDRSHTYHVFFFDGSSRLGEEFQDGVGSFMIRLPVRIDAVDQLLLGVRVLVHALVHGLARSLLSAGLSSAFRGMGGGEAWRGSQVGADTALSPFATTRRPAGERSAEGHCSSTSSSRRGRVRGRWQ